MARKKINLAILVSGRGSNLQAILAACRGRSFPARVAVVISNNPRAFALKRAKKAKVPAVVIDPALYRTRPAQEKAINQKLAEYKVDLVCLAGYMRLLSPAFVAGWRGKIMNIHPALLPAFPGLHVQKQALEYGVKYSGCTVHLVDEGTDTGPIIVQAVVEVKDKDTPETLAGRILKKEHQLYPRAIRLFAEGKLRIKGRRVEILCGR